MLNDRLAASKMVAEKLFALESALDDALKCAGELSTALPAARQRAKLSAVVGQQAFASTSEAVAALFTARARIVEAHNNLAEVHEQIGLKTYAGTSLWKIADARLPTMQVVEAA